MYPVPNLSSLCRFIMDTVNFKGSDGAMEGRYGTRYRIVTFIVHSYFNIPKASKPFTSVNSLLDAHSIVTYAKRVFDLLLLPLLLQHR